MNTIAGPLRGVLRVCPPELRPVMVHGGYRVMWAQMIREEAGWDEITVACSDTTVHPTLSHAQATATALTLAGEKRP